MFCWKYQISELFKAGVPNGGDLSKFRGNSETAKGGCDLKILVDFKTLKLLLDVLEFRWRAKKSLRCFKKAVALLNFLKGKLKKEFGKPCF